MNLPTVIPMKKKEDKETIRELKQAIKCNAI